MVIAFGRRGRDVEQGAHDSCSLLTQAIVDGRARARIYELLPLKASYKMSGQFYILLEVRNVNFRDVRQRIVKQQQAHIIVC